MPRDVILRIKN